MFNRLPQQYSNQNQPQQQNYGRGQDHRFPNGSDLINIDDINVPAASNVYVNNYFFNSPGAYAVEFGFGNGSAPANMAMTGGNMMGRASTSNPCNPGLPMSVSPFAGGTQVQARPPLPASSFLTNSNELPPVWSIELLDGNQTSRSGIQQESLYDIIITPSRMNTSTAVDASPVLESSNPK